MEQSESQTNEPKNTESSQAIKKSAPNKRVLKIIGIVVGAVLAVVLAIIVTVTVSTDAPMKISDKYVANIQDGKAEAAYNLMSDEAQKVTDPADFVSVVNQISPILTGQPKNTSREIEAATGKSTQATIVYEISGSDGKNYNFTVTLVEEDDKWEVLNFETKLTK